MGVLSDCVRKPKLKPSVYQRRIFDWISKGEGNACVNAVAGSGKTTTACMATEFVSGGSALFVAFNKSIANELQRRIGREVECKTLHSVGFRTLIRARNNSYEVDGSGSKNRGILMEIAGNRDTTDVLKLVSLAKNYGVGIVSRCDEENFAAVADSFDLDVCERSIGLAKQVFEKSLVYAESGVIDFDDMLYLPLKLKLNPPQYDWVFVDEAQDVNSVQLALLLKLLRGRMVAIGDPRQAIYGFRGAGVDAFDTIQTSTKAELLPLSICYRCAKSIVLRAQEEVPEIEYAEGAPEGEVVEVEGGWVPVLDGNSAILCRTNAPLVRLALAFLAAGIPCNMVGRDIGTSLASLTKKIAGSELEVWRKNLHKYFLEKSLAWQRSGKISAIESLRDKITCLDAILDYNTKISTKESLLEFLAQLFTQKQGAVVLSTVHRAKGLEWDRVYLLDANQLLPPFWTPKLPSWAQQQERNLVYVAVTRARKELYFVQSEECERCRL